MDQKESLAAHLPWAITVIALTTIVALFLMTGSVILPIKAVLMNVLTLGATLGHPGLDLPGRPPRGAAVATTARGRST